MGQRAFNQCRGCHTVERGRSGAGLNPYGVLGRRAAAEGVRYSTSMRQKADDGLTWPEETLRPYPRNPRKAVPGTAMEFACLRNEQQLSDLPACLKQATGSAQ